MCGVPVHAAESYLLTLIRKGFRVAVCEQMEDPAEAKKRGGSKAVVRREVVRLVTPGTLTEDTLLDARTHNYLAAWADVRGEGALAWTDISTGDLNVMPCPRCGWGRNCSACRCARCWFRPTWMDVARQDASRKPGRPSRRWAGQFRLVSAEKRLSGLFDVASLDAFGIVLARRALGAGRAVRLPRDHAEGRPAAPSPATAVSAARLMQIDVATRRNLELTRSLSGAPAGSLLHSRPYGHGRRRAFAGTARVRARDQMRKPSRRHDAVAHFVSDMRVRDEIRASLRQCPDIERALSRLALDRGGPRDLAALRDGLAQAAVIADRLPAAELPDILLRARSDCLGHEALRDMLDAALVAEPPVQARDGGFIAPRAMTPTSTRPERSGTRGAASSPSCRRITSPIPGCSR
jgi:DNA mismatch repair protein MutS